MWPLSANIMSYFMFYGHLFGSKSCFMSCFMFCLLILYCSHFTCFMFYVQYMFYVLYMFHGLYTHNTHNTFGSFFYLYSFIFFSFCLSSQHLEVRSCLASDILIPGCLLGQIYMVIVYDFTYSCNFYYTYHSISYL